MGDETVSIIGCGWLGLPLAKHLVAAGYRVTGSTTSAEKIDLLQQEGILAQQLTFSPEPVGNLTALLQADVLVINIPPKAAKVGPNVHPKQIQYLTNAIRQSAIKHVIYVSSTSVYPEQNQIAIESDITAPDRSAAPALVEAEQLVLALAPERTVTILRCGGLMGYDRIPGKYVAGRTVDSGAAPVNYLHRDDAVGIVSTLIRQKTPGVFNAVAPQHPTREAIYRKSCADFGYAVPTFVEPTEPISYKTISVEKLLQATNYEFRYPDPLGFLQSM